MSNILSYYFNYLKTYILNTSLVREAQQVIYRDNDLSSTIELATSYSTPYELVSDTVKLYIDVTVDWTYNLRYMDNPPEEFDYTVEKLVDYLQLLADNGVYIRDLDYIKEILRNDTYIRRSAILNTHNSSRYFVFTNTYTEARLIIEKTYIPNDTRISINIDAVFPELYVDIEAKNIGQNIKSAVY